MACSCDNNGGGDQRTEGWRLIPELQLAQQPLTNGPGAPAGMRTPRAPGWAADRGPPWWVWVGLALLTALLLRGRA